MPAAGKKWFAVNVYQAVYDVAVSLETGINDINHTISCGFHS